MEFVTSPVERAFQLAKSGKYKGVSEIKQRLKAEGYALTQIQGPALLKQLNALAKHARADQTGSE
jgi:hypothetical protein